MLIYVVDKTLATASRDRVLPRKIKVKADVFLVGPKTNNPDRKVKMDVRMTCDLGPAGKIIIGFVVKDEDFQPAHSVQQDNFNFRR